MKQKENKVDEKTKKTNASEKSINKTRKSNTKENKTTKEKKDFDIVKVEGYHNLSLYTYVFDYVKNPKAVVIVIHGMQEHAGRYQDFARFLNQNGYIVIMNDLRGHGHTMPSKAKYGFGEKDIFVETLQDELILIEKAKEAYNLPIYLFGHSYGSMISQGLIKSTDIIEKCVLCGTANGSSFIMRLGAVAASVLSIFKKSSSKSGYIEKKCISSYGKKFDDGNWFTRDSGEFQKYKEDELCGGTFPFSFYHSMLTNMRKQNKNIEKIGKKKVFIICGDKDPVGNCGKQIKSLNKLYLKNKIDSKFKIYKDCRHELLNELNKQDVYADVLNFFEN